MKKLSTIILYKNKDTQKRVSLGVKSKGIYGKLFDNGNKHATCGVAQNNKCDIGQKFIGMRTATYKEIGKVGNAVVEAADYKHHNGKNHYEKSTDKITLFAYTAVAFDCRKHENSAEKCQDKNAHGSVGNL